MKGPTQRTLALMRKLGWNCAVVEKWIPQTRRRLDMFGAIDIVAIRPGETAGIQCTSQSNASARIKKLQAEPNMKDWLAAGNRLMVIGWAKKGPRGKRKTWQPTVTEITADKLDELS